MFREKLRIGGDHVDPRGRARCKINKAVKREKTSVYQSGDASSTDRNQKTEENAV